MDTGPGDITQLLADIRDGSREAESRLAELVYSELHGLAKRRMRVERADHSLQPTLLVNEAFMRLVRQDGTTWTDRKHFFAVAATMMRRILIDHARSIRAGKRGAGAKIRLDTTMAITDENLDELLVLDEALIRL